MENETLNREIATLEGKIEKETPGTEQYSKLVEHLSRLEKIRNDRLETNAKIEQEDRKIDLEIMKIHEDRDAAELKAKVDSKEANLGVVKVALTVLASVALTVFAVYSEESKIIAGKSWNMATKILKV